MHGASAARGAAGHATEKGWIVHLLGAESIRLIEHENFRGVVELQGLIVIAVAIAFGCRKIAILLLVFLGDFGRGLFAVIRRRLAFRGLLAGSGHFRALRSAF